MGLTDSVKLLQSERYMTYFFFFFGKPFTQEDGILWLEVILAPRGLIVVDLSLNGLCILTWGFGRLKAAPAVPCETNKMACCEG